MFLSNLYRNIVNKPVTEHNTHTQLGLVWLSAAASSHSPSWKKEILFAIWQVKCMMGICDCINWLFVSDVSSQIKNKRHFTISVDACVSLSLSCPPSNNQLNSHPECFSELCLHIHHLLEGVPKHRAASLLGNRHQIPRSSSSTRFPLPRPTPHFTRLGSVKSDLGNEKCHLHSLGNPSSVRLEFLMSRLNLAAGRCRPISHFTSGAFMLMLRFSGGYWRELVTHVRGGVGMWVCELDPTNNNTHHFEIKISFPHNAQHVCGGTVKVAKTSGNESCAALNQSCGWKRATPS